MSRFLLAGLVLVLWGCGGASGDEPAPAAAGAGGSAGQSGAGSGGEAGSPQGSGAGGAAGAGGAKPPPFVADPEARTRLSEAGFFADLESKQPAADLVAFEPRFAFWSDGVEKKRWLWLPPGTKVDASDPDHWRFPIGARLYKEFSQNGKRLETRLVERTGPGTFDYWMGAFVWLEDQSDAVFAEEGAADVLGTQHDVPKAKLCPSCHNGEPSRVLGFSAMQLEGSPVAAMGLVDPPPPAVPGPPGGDVARAALGYLHANCGHCHYDGGLAWRDTDVVLRLSVAETTVESSEIYTSNLGVPVQFFQEGGLTLRVDGGAPDQSALLFRMNYRGDDKQMPPIATERVDEQGVRLVRDWIMTLP
ncbi:MAG TPA: hypothetical protein VFS43_43865 [Polyangiaceae bacterium]|nr:hypothetical protein [Polyangiaceae bacterium]